MLSIAEIQQLIHRRLEAESFLHEPESLYEPIRYIMSIGGKRLRPMLLVMAAQLYGKPADEALEAAMGLEVFHNFTLMHDDIMDHAPLRRGKATVHHKWDINKAILSGDTMMVMAYDYLIRTESVNLVDIIKTFNCVAREVCEGQQFDMDFEQRLDVTLDEYMEMIRLKTAVLMAAALKIGGLLAEAPAVELDLLYRFGEKIGLAFQLKDDLLDVFGDEKKFGKQTGNDILANKKTFLLVQCLADTTPEDRATLLGWLDSTNRPEEKVAAVTALYRKYDIAGKTNQQIESLYEAALTLLGHLNVPEERKMLFVEFTRSLKIREV
jgi:geranylgeranyl diphosphate synthase, type II